MVTVPERYRWTDRRHAISLPRSALASRGKKPTSTQRERAGKGTGRDGKRGEKKDGREDKGKGSGVPPPLQSYILTTDPHLCKLVNILSVSLFLVSIVVYFYRAMH